MPPAQAKNQAEVSAAALLLTQKGNLPKPEALSLASTLTRIGGTVDNIRHAVTVMLSRPNVQNRGGFLVGAIKAAVAGNAYLLPSGAAPVHASDRGERPVQVDRAPREDVLRHQAEQKAQRDRQQAQRAAWEALSEPGRGVWIDRALAELLPTERVQSVRDRMKSERGEHHRVLAGAKRLFNENIPASGEAL